MILILAPHVDDELIGCWSLISRYAEEVKVCYTERMEQTRWNEAEHCASSLGFQLCGLTIDFDRLIYTRPEVVLAPDPHWELHPTHKTVGQKAWSQCSFAAIPFVSYSTNMNAPYIQELPYPEAQRKKEALDKYFPSQRDLWAYDHRYWLFEGLSQWNAMSWPRFKNEKR